jgi:hypothetical protein
MVSDQIKLLKKVVLSLYVLVQIKHQCAKSPVGVYATVFFDAQLLIENFRRDSVIRSGKIVDPLEYGCDMVLMGMYVLGTDLDDAFAVLQMAVMPQIESELQSL